MKLARDGFVTYDEADGISTVGAIFGDRTGAVCFRGYVLGDERRTVFDGAKLDLRRTPDNYYFRYGRFDGHNFTWFMPREPKSGNFGWVNERVTLQALNGEWWLGTGDGIYRFPPSDDFSQVKTARPLAVFRTKEPVAGYEQVFRIFEDSRGDIWASTTGSPNGLARWERATEIFLRNLADSPGLPSSREDLARSFAEDRSGNVWIGFSTGLARYRDGHFSFFTSADGLPPGAVQYIYADSRGRLWLASARSGLVLVDNPEADRPTFTSYTTAEGLSSNSAAVVIEDLSGYIYVSTGRGLDRLHTETGRIKHFTTADGLVPGVIVAAFRDRQGALWFGGLKGISRLSPAPEVPIVPPPIVITGLLVAGERKKISALGETAVSLPDLPASQNELQIEFVGLSFAPGEVLRYQYRLEGAADDWGPAVDQRTVNLANLAPGRYRFLVRAVNSDGVASTSPAAISFVVMRPLWQRWWSLALLALTGLLVAYALYRYRVSRLLEVANMRTRIATDLHDDIGANLTKIAILSEVAQHQLEQNTIRREDKLFLSIADISRESVSSMSDIVWAINPKKDSLLDLTRRMRGYAEETLQQCGIRLKFEAPLADSDLKLDANTRRNIYLIFKESLNNIVRHSQASKVEVDLKIAGKELILQIRDNGKGFDTSQEYDGNGLLSIKKRAADAGGSLQINSSDGAGTKIVLRAPIFNLHKLAG
ncbi:MAG: histidine kinase [Acidobacteria bacterium]|nr:histidine kinase [Acidobacteriota bacterium]